MRYSQVRHGAALFLFAIAVSCGSGGGGSGETLFDVCGCVPTSPPSKDHRHDQKHVPLPNQTPQDITVATVISWAIDPTLLLANAPRAGRELTMFHIPNAFLQAVRVEHNDCDIHFEIADSSDKTAPRIIVETPVDSEYCPARQAIQSQLAQHGIFIGHEQEGEPPREITPPISADVIGLAFEDDSHPNRGSAQVATIWELHPAIVKLLQ